MSAFHDNEEISLSKTFYYFKRIFKQFDVNEEFTSTIVIEIILKTLFRSRKCKCSRIECIKEWLYQNIKDKDLPINHCSNGCHEIGALYNICTVCKKRICSDCCAIYPGAYGYESGYSEYNDEHFDDNPICKECYK